VVPTEASFGVAVSLATSRVLFAAGSLFAELGGASLGTLAEELREGRGTDALAELGGASLASFFEAGASAMVVANALLSADEPCVDESCTFCAAAGTPLVLADAGRGAAGSGSSTIAKEGMADTFTICLVKPGVGVSPGIDPRPESGPPPARVPNRSGSVPPRRRALCGGMESLVVVVTEPLNFAAVPFDCVVEPFDFAPIAHAGRRLRASASARSTSNPGGGLAELGTALFEESALPMFEDFSPGLDIEMVVEPTTAHADRQRERGTLCGGG
jgi:hypothetical protein